MSKKSFSSFITKSLSVKMKQTLKSHSCFIYNIKLLETKSIQIITGELTKYFLKEKNMSLIVKKFSTVQELQGLKVNISALQRLKDEFAKTQNK